MTAQVIVLLRGPSTFLRHESIVFLRSNVNKSVTKLRMKFLPEVQAGNLSAHALLAFGNH
jgi:hypothetical protein